METAETSIPTIRDAPWVHRGNGVILNAKKRVLGAFENRRDAEAVVALVNALAGHEGSSDHGR